MNDRSVENFLEQEIELASKDSREVTMWEETLATIAGYLREAFHFSFTFKDDGDVSPKILALRDALYAFPVPTDVLLVDCGKIQTVHPRIFLDTAKEEGPIWTVIAHHAGTHQTCVTKSRSLPSPGAASRFKA
jgi:hypothetical protein